MRAGCARLNLLIVRGRSSAHCRSALGLAGLAALWFVLELFVVKEKLFASRENELSAAVDAFQNPVLKLHMIRPRRLPRTACASSSWRRGKLDSWESSRFGFGPPFRFRNGLQQTLLRLVLPNDKGRLFGGLSQVASPVLYELSSGCAFAPAPLSRAFFRRV